MTVTVHILQGDVHSVRLLFLRCHTGRKAGMLASQKERREGGTSVEYDLILARSVTYAQRMQKSAEPCRDPQPDLPGAPGPDGSGLRLCGADLALRSGERPCRSLRREGLGPLRIYVQRGGDIPGGGPMIYLDSAATTFQKPPAVARAMTEALASMSSPGRGGHPLAMRAADTAFRCRYRAGGAV